MVVSGPAQGEGHKAAALHGRQHGRWTEPGVGGQTDLGSNLHVPPRSRANGQVIWLLLSPASGAGMRR